MVLTVGAAQTGGDNSGGPAMILIVFSTAHDLWRELCVPLDTEVVALVSVGPVFERFDKPGQLLRPRPSIAGRGDAGQAGASSRSTLLRFYRPSRLS
jgi:hypothetical protein